MKKEKNSSELFLRIIESFIAVSLIVVLTISLVRMSSESSREGRDQLESIIVKSVMACYADEGVYPADLQYLEDHYGLQINRDKYIVRYESFAENLMPDITVLEKNR